MESKDLNFFADAKPTFDMHVADQYFLINVNILMTFA